MVLSAAETEKIVESETLKEEIRKALQPPKSGLSDFWKQVLLLIIGFGLTAGAGGFLTWYWKAKEAKNERSYLAERQALQKEYAIIDKTAQEVATTVAAADDVLSTYYDRAEWTPKEIDERSENWTRTSREWRINAQLLSVQIASAFSDPEINQLFLQITQKRTALGRVITNLPRSKREIDADKTLKSELENANSIKLEIIDLLHKCSNAMTNLAKHSTDQP